MEPRNTPDTWTEDKSNIEAGESNRNTCFWSNLNMKILPEWLTSSTSREEDAFFCTDLTDGLRFRSTIGESI